MSQHADPRNLTGPLSLLQCAEVAAWYEDIRPHLLRWLETRGHVSAREAEDTVQDVFIRVITHAPQLAQFSAKDRRNYVFAIAANLTATRVRRWYARGQTPVALAVYGSDAVDEVLSVSDPANTRGEWLAHAKPDAQPEQTTAARMTLRAVWDATPDEFRELLLLVAHGYSLDEMATRLGVTKPSISSRIWRLRGILRAAREQMEA